VVAPLGRLRLTSEGMVWLAVTVVLGVVGWYKSLNLVLLFSYAMAALLVLNGLVAWAQVRRVTARRVPLPPVFAGEQAALAVTVRNSGRRQATVGVTVQAGETAGRWLLYRLRGGAEAACSERRTFPRRGRFRGAPLLVWSGFPFGFLRHERRADAGADVVVLPTPGVVDADGLRRWLLRQAAGEGRARKVLRRVTSDQADVRGVRPYRAGDSPRSVHWRTSARLGELMVREYDAAPSPDLVLVVEPWLPAHPTARERANLEAALSLAAAVATAWSRDVGIRVTVAVAGERAAVRTGPPTEAFMREALAPLAGVTGGPAFEPLGPEAFDRPLASAARVLVSSRRDSPYAAALARSAGRPFAAIDPSADLPWYRPPATAG
jgi:uncharacterized protein (DUF58 family)